MLVTIALTSAAVLLPRVIRSCKKKETPAEEQRLKTSKMEDKNQQETKGADTAGGDATASVSRASGAKEIKEGGRFEAQTEKVIQKAVKKKEDEKGGKKSSDEKE